MLSSAARSPSKREHCVSTRSKASCGRSLLCESKPQLATAWQCATPLQHAGGLVMATHAVSGARRSGAFTGLDQERMELPLLAGCLRRLSRQFGARVAPAGAPPWSFTSAATLRRRPWPASHLNGVWLQLGSTRVMVGNRRLELGTEIQNPAAGVAAGNGSALASVTTALIVDLCSRERPYRKRFWP